MAANNQVVVIGRTGNNASDDMRYLPSGSVKAEVRLAVNRTQKDEMGNLITDWISCVFWNKQAEILGEYVKKGDLISVSGSLRVDQWETNTGEKRKTVFVYVENFQMLESKAKKEERRASGNQNFSTAPPLSDSMPADELKDDFSPSEDDDELPPF